MEDNIAQTKAKIGNMGYKLPETAALCQQALVKVTRQLKATLQEELETKNLRRQHQEKLIAEHEAAGNSKTAKKIRGIQRAEQVKRVFQRCKAARQLGSEGGLSHILVPDNPTSDPRACAHWIRIDDPSEMTNLLMERNQQHFGQSKSCTLTKPPLDFTMEFTATSNRADAILEGAFLQPSLSLPSEGTNPSLLADDETDTSDHPSHQPLHLQWSVLPEMTQLLIDSFKYATKPDIIPPELTKEEYKGKLKVWDEGTSTSPTSHMHLGHLKAYWSEHTLPDGGTEAKALEKTRHDILNGHILLLNYAMQFSYSFNKWKRIVNTMLEKDKGLPKIHQLRVIHLYEADYNLILGVKWRQVLHHAITHQLLNEGCYGSQPGKEATDALLIRELEYEMNRLTRKASLHFDNDATSCYDRIPCFLANLAS